MFEGFTLGSSCDGGFEQLSTTLQQRRRLRAAQKTKSTPSISPVVTSQLRRSLRTRKSTSRYKEQTNAAV